jgi:adenine-specific DNA methylase
MNRSMPWSLIRPTTTTSDLSDFFYVWLKRPLQSLYPDDLTAEQTPKRQEATVVPYRYDGDEQKARRHYEDLMARALAEAGRTLRPGGPLVVVYAHKTARSLDTRKSVAQMVPRSEQRSSWMKRNG